MITEDRLAYFKRSFAAYCDQDYENKELVIVSCGSREYKRTLGEYVNRSGRSDVHCAFLDRRVTLGALRNASLERANGPLVCQWDDDDISHPRRLSSQIAALIDSGDSASYLGEHLHFMESSRQLVWMDWRTSTTHIGHPATLIAYKNSVPFYNCALNNCEDTEMQHALREHGSVDVVRGMGYLYVYTYHGNNVTPWGHHASLLRAYGLGKAASLQRCQVLGSELDDALRYVGRPISVRDNNGIEVVTLG